MLPWDHNAFYDGLVLRQLPHGASRVLEVGRRAASVLPGVRVRRLVLWRYLLTWQAPAAGRPQDT